MTPLSIYVLTHNSEKHLAAVLAAARRMADDLLVLDSGSIDATLAIAAEHGARIAQRPFDDFREQRLHANQLCQHRHVLFMDSDEIASDALIDAICALKQRGFEHDAYVIRRDWFVLGQRIHALFPVGCPDYPIRLIDKDKVGFGQQSVHEQPVGYASLGRIDAPMTHYTFETHAEIARKLDRYTDLAAADLHRRGKKRTGMRVKQWTSPIAAFLKWYIKSGGWRDGRVGITLALYAAAYTHRKYRKACQLVA